MRILIVFLLGLVAFPLLAHAEPKVIIKKPPAAQCKVLIDSLKQQLEIGNHCRTDADCAAIGLGCPLPCFSPINTGEDIKRMVALKESYDHLCGSCTYKCAAPDDQPLCIEGKCVIK